MINRQPTDNGCFDQAIRHDPAFGIVVEVVNGNIRMLINRGRGYQNLHYLVLKAQRLAASNLELITVRRIWKAA